MNETANDPAAAFQAARRDAKRLLRTARTGALATLDEGRPLTTLIGVASDWDGAPLFLMSELSRHTRNLAVDARVSLLLTSEGGRGDPLNHPRITLNGTVGRREGADGRDRYIRRNPKAKLYVDFADFSLRRLEIGSVHFNGGFGRADKLTVADILTAGGAAELAQAQDDLLARVEALGDGAIAGLAGGGTSRPYKPVGLDAEGLDLSRGGEAARVDFDAPARDAKTWWAALQQRLAS
jgi:putative heme iron utilization protein